MKNVLRALCFVLLAGCGSPEADYPSADDIAAAKANGNKKAILAVWNKNPETNIDHYVVYRGTGNPCSTPVQLTVLTGLKYLDSIPVNKHGACYEITAVNTSGLESLHTERVSVTW